MKILIYSRSTRPKLGGLETHVHELANALARLGNEVTIVSWNKIFEYAQHYTQLNIVKNFRQFIFYIKNAEVVHLHGSRDLTGSFIAIFSKCPVILTPHCFYESTRWPKRFIKYLFDKSIGGLSLRKCNYVIALTEIDKQKFIEVFNLDPKKVKVISNGLNLELVENILSARENKNLLLPKQPYLVFTGRIDRNKNVVQLVRMANKYLVESNLKLVVIGPDGGELSNVIKEIGKLPKNVQKRIIILGEIQYSQLIQVVSRAEVLLLPSNNEGMPTSIIEALYLGIPCVASSVGGNLELCSKLPGIFLFEYDNDSEFIEAIGKAQVFRIDIGEIRQEISKRFSWRQISEEISLLYMAAQKHE